MCSVDFDAIKQLQHEGDWDRLAVAMKDAARSGWNAAGPTSSFCAPTRCIAWPMRSNRPSSIPLLHIADPTAEQIKAAGFRRVGLLGTAFTMEQDFYKGRLQQHHGLDVIVPDESDRRVVHEIIYKELVLGKIEPESRQAYRAIIARLIERGAQCVILGCTEIMLLVSDEDSAVPLFDTTTIHALAAVDEALKVAVIRHVMAGPCAGRSTIPSGSLALARDRGSAGTQAVCVMRE